LIEENVIQEALNACCCGTIGSPLSVRLCPTCHRYWKGDKELVGVTKLLKTTWPFKPDFSQALPEVLENARDRGIVVDTLFSAYVSGTLDTIPRGTRSDAIELFFKLKDWWDGRHKDARAQVILADDDIAGTCDLVADDWIYDVKSTYNVEAMYQLQLGFYAVLHFATFGRPAKGIGIIHVTKRYPAPKLIKLDMPQCMQDALLLRDCYFMAHRRQPKQIAK
jgi:hypothetical protein